MALKDNRGGREYDKFAALSDGSTAIQVSTFSGGGADAVTSTHPAASSQTWAGTELCIVPKTTIEGRQGNFFVRNTQATHAMTFKMYTSSKETPSVPAENTGVTATLADADGDWDQVGSDVTIAAGTNKHIPWTNSYRHIAASITMAGSTTDIDAADIEVYAI